MSGAHWQALPPVYCSHSGAEHGELSHGARPASPPAQQSPAGATGKYPKANCAGGSALEIQPQANYQTATDLAHHSSSVNKRKP